MKYIKATIIIAAVLFLMNPLSAADMQDADRDRLENLLNAISRADEQGVKAQLTDLMNANKLSILNQHTMYYSPLGIVNDYLQHFADDYGLNKAALSRIKLQLQQHGANLDYSSFRKHIEEQSLPEIKEPGDDY